MTARKYISIKSVLYELSTLIEPEHWDESRFMEWAVKAASKINLESKFEDDICITTVASHKATMPTDWKYINMIIYKENTADDAELTAAIARALNLDDAEANPAMNHMYNLDDLLESFANPFTNGHGYRPLRRTSSFYMDMVHCDDDFYVCPECVYEYNISTNGIISTTLSDGVIAISYKRLPKDMNGDLLIVDDEDLKEAITHYCLYRYYLRKSLYSEEGANRERDWHLERFNALAIKSRNIDLPDIDQMENMSNYGTRIVPRRHMYDTYFNQLGYKENNRL